MGPFLHQFGLYGLTNVLDRVWHIFYILLSGLAWTHFIYIFIYAIAS